MATVEVLNLFKTFADGTTVVRDVSLNVPSGGFCVLLGPSGCGKTTTLRMIAGLEAITSGEIRIDGTRVNDVDPKDRDVAMVFQNYALYPHLTVAENIAFPLAMRGVAKATRAERVREVAGLLELGELLGRRPAQLSGGQRQRVAMARAIVRQPKVFLFDEPLSNLDARLRAQTRRELKELHRRVKITSVYVTHDQEEAMSLADLVVVMAKGQLQQAAAPFEVFQHPVNRFVAGFVGTPTMNFVQVALSQGRSGVEARFGINVIRVGNVMPSGMKDGESCMLGVRPGALTLLPDGASAAGHADGSGVAGVVSGVVESWDLLGEASDIGVRVGKELFVARVPTPAWVRVGAPCQVVLAQSGLHFFAPGEFGKACVMNDNPKDLKSARDAGERVEHAKTLVAN